MLDSNLRNLHESVAETLNIDVNTSTQHTRSYQGVDALLREKLHRSDDFEKDVPIRASMKGSAGEVLGQE